MRKCFKNKLCASHNIVVKSCRYCVSIVKNANFVPVYELDFTIHPISWEPLLEFTESVGTATVNATLSTHLVTD